ncbi:MAG: beta-ketoacyl synthase N-terminal-like domain-containing protein [Candidatus Binatia bacterium]
MNRTAGSAAPIAVTGIGVVSPIGVGAAQFWGALCAGRSGVTAVDDAMRAETLPRLSAAVRGFASREFISSPHHRRMDGLSRFIVAACRMALDDAAVPRDTASERMGIVVGSALGDVRDSTQHLNRVFLHGPAAVSPMLFPNLVLNAPASYAAMVLGATGVNLTVAQSEVSGEAAIALGCDLVRSGQADVVLAGGGDQIAPIVVDAARRAGALAGQRGGREWSSPYDAERSGVVFGEGAAILVLEPLARARERGAAIYACIEEIAFFAVPAPRYGWPRCAGDGLPALAALCDGAAVDLVCGGANSTRRLDACELELFASLAPARDAVLTSIKGAVGEFGAAGALSAAAACLALRDQVAPPLCNLRTPAAGAIRLAPVRAEPLHGERALVCGIARGGAGAALLLRRASDVAT